MALSVTVRAIERAPIHANADRAVILDRRFDHDAEIVVVLLADVYVAGIDAVFGEGLGPNNRGRNAGRVCIRHRLDDDRIRASHFHTNDVERVV